MGEHEWRWKDGYEFDNAYELEEMMLTLKPNEALCMRACITTLPRHVLVRRLPNGEYRVSTTNGAVRFKSWTVIDRHTITLRDDCGIMLEYISLYAWEFVKKDTLETGWLYGTEDDGCVIKESTL